MSLFHISTQRVRQHCKPILPRKDLSSDLTELKTSHVCIKGLDWSREELPKLGEGILSNDLGNGEIS